MRPTALSAIVTVVFALQASPSWSDEGTSWLFVLTGDQARINERTVTLHESDNLVFGFTDRPNRLHATIPIKDFATMWAAGSSFSDDHPNAVLTYAGDSGMQELEMTLVCASADANGISFDFKVLTGDIPSELGAYSLFVDPLPSTELVYASTFVPFDSSF